MLPMLYVRLTIKVKVGIPENFKAGWYPHKITGSSHLKNLNKKPNKNLNKNLNKIIIRSSPGEIL